MARRKCFLKSLKFLAEDRLSQRQHLFFISWQRTPSNEEDKKGKEEKRDFILKGLSASKENLDGSVLKSSLDIQARERRRKAFRSKKKNFESTISHWTSCRREGKSKPISLTRFFVVGTRHSS
jgi:hypothetical protein